MIIRRGASKDKKKWIIDIWYKLKQMTYNDSLELIYI